jgi:drug/metabolite transporter (DMT)-like permease
MTAALIGQLVGMFAAMLGVAAIWLLICYAIPSLRRRPRLTYIAAMVLVAGMAFVSIEGVTGTSLGAAILCVALLYWQMRRAERRRLVPQSTTTA